MESEARGGQSASLAVDYPSLRHSVRAAAERSSQQEQADVSPYWALSGYANQNEPVFLLTVISKGKQANLTGAQKNELKKGKGK
ncbi:MAG: hypothetical protein QM605_00555 [Sphingobium sp.]